MTICVSDRPVFFRGVAAIVISIILLLLTTSVPDVVTSFFGFALVEPQDVTFFKPLGFVLVIIGFMIGPVFIILSITWVRGDLTPYTVPRAYHNAVCKPANIYCACQCSCHATGCELL